MKKFLAVAAVAAATFATASFITPTKAEAAYCEARSPYASGWGQGSLGYARQRALRECAIRTPRGYTCYITHCRH
ncbi:MAG: hypothetical protein K2P86_07115 [Xanthobacteraceae bacterium]|jgi:archaellin|nr:hypothetical protein [Xanthobacteraceae bacterium]